MPAGRPRKTCREEVLEKAMKSFWARGFEATSMNDLVNDTGMAKPGLYAAFGDKESLFGKALDHYAEAHARPLLDRFRESPAPLADSLRVLLRSVAQAAQRDEGPGGCLIVNTIIECACGPERLQDMVERHSASRAQAVTDRFCRAIADGDLPPDADPVGLAEFYGGQAVALAVMGRAGAGTESLEAFVETALGALPARSG
jgi:AcrR family transcriptional regulator